jgi:hypothetical protein
MNPERDPNPQKSGPTHLYPRQTGGRVCAVWPDWAKFRHLGKFRIPNLSHEGQIFWWNLRIIWKIKFAMLFFTQVGLIIGWFLEHFGRFRKHFWSHWVCVTGKTSFHSPAPSCLDIFIADKGRIVAVTIGGTLCPILFAFVTPDRWPKLSGTGQK